MLTSDEELITSLRVENGALKRRIAELELSLAQRNASPASSPERTPADAVHPMRHLEQMFMQSPIAIIETDLAQKARLWNHTAERIFGYSASEMLGQNPFRMLLQTDDHGFVEHELVQMRAQGWSRRIQAATTRSGSTVMCSWLATYLTDTSGQVTGIGCFIRDVSAEQEADRVRKEAEALFAAVFETVGVGLCITDEEGYFVRVNSAYCTLYGFSREELVGQHFTVILPPEQHVWAREGYAMLAQGALAEMVPSIELDVKRRDGSPLILLTTYSSTSLGGDRRVQISAVTDISERKAQAAELQRRMLDAEREAVEKTRLLVELDQKLELIARQHQQILELSAPMLAIWDSVLLLPLIGRIDGNRVNTIAASLLQEVAQRHTRSVILDMTSLELLDKSDVGYLGTLVQALRLLGVRSIITGVRPTTAQAMVQMGVDLQGVLTLRDLQQGLRACIRS